MGNLWSPTEPQLVTSTKRAFAGHRGTGAVSSCLVLAGVKPLQLHSRALTLGIHCRACVQHCS